MSWSWSEEDYERPRLVVVTKGLFFAGIAGQERESSSRERAEFCVSDLGQRSRARCLVMGVELSSKP